jgi:hypothetical protein
VWVASARDSGGRGYEISIREPSGSPFTLNDACDEQPAMASLSPSETPVGKFDPVNQWLHLNISNRVDLPELLREDLRWKDYFPENNFFHEIVHSWQFYATRVGA